MSKPPNDDSLDWGLVREIRCAIADRLGNFTPAEEGRGREIVRGLLAVREDEAIADGRRPLDPDQARLVAEAVISQLFKLGRFQPLIDDPNVGYIEVNGYDNVAVHYTDGRLELSPAVAENDRALEEYIAFIGTRAGGISRQSARRCMCSSKPVSGSQPGPGSRTGPA